MSDGKYSAWHADEHDLSETIHPQRARDLIIECFFEAQRETFERTKQNLGVATDDAAIRRSIVSVVRLSFDQVDGDFDSPTRTSLEQVVAALAAHAAAWGTPSDIIEHHRMEIEKVMARCAVDPEPSAQVR